MTYNEFETIEELDEYLKQSTDLSKTVFQALDLTKHNEILKDIKTYNEAIFLGCNIPLDLFEHIVKTGGLVFPAIQSIPFNAYQNHLYSPDELMGSYVPGEAGSYDKTLDGRIYKHYVDTGKANAVSILETIARRLHDHAISDALEEMIADRRIVAIMGGHSMKRSNPDFLKVAMISRELTRKGYLMISGGGPGAMEATHLGAWFVSRTQEELEDAVNILGQAPLYKPREEWLDTAFEVKNKYPLKPKDDGNFPKSLGIPTWLYGHEPPTIFATHIAKYFANSVREEGLLAIAKNGVIFAPGSAGTIQEIFQDATQNHYNSFGIVSPMIFLGEDYWKWRKPVFPLLAGLAAGQEYSKLLQITDSISDVVKFIEEFSAKAFE